MSATTLWIYRYHIIIPASQLAAANQWCVTNFPDGEAERDTFTQRLDTAGVTTHYGCSTLATQEMSNAIQSCGLTGWTYYQCDADTLALQATNSLSAAHLGGTYCTLDDAALEQGLAPHVVPPGY